MEIWQKLSFKRPIQKLIKAISELRSAQIIFGGYSIVILIGAILLSMPFSSTSGVSVGLLDALFTATSATCVTGLVVFVTATTWTLFGKIVILTLIQVGGMGFMTVITMLLIATGQKITLKDRLVIQESLNQADLQGLVRLVQRVVVGTFMMEGVAAVILALNFLKQENFGFLKAIWYGVFHAVSAFNNAGLDILGEVSLAEYADDGVVNTVVMLLIVLGGIGYAVWLDIINAFKKCKKTNQITPKYLYRALTLHGKMVLEITFVLIVGGAIFFFFAERNNPLTFGSENYSLTTEIYASFFHSVTSRTAGFFTVNPADLTVGSKFMTTILMFIGGSPGGTAGGIKTVTIGVLFACVLSVAKGKQDIEVHRRALSNFLLKKALVVILLNLTIIVVATIALGISEASVVNIGDDFLAILFEVTSAVGTVGLSVGITPYLSAFGKVVIIMCMFYGRVGPITLAVAMLIRQVSSTKGIRYPEEKIFVG